MALLKKNWSVSERIKIFLGMQFLSSFTSFSPYLLWYVAMDISVLIINLVMLYSLVLQSNLFRSGQVEFVERSGEMKYSGVV